MRLLLLSNSTNAGERYLEYALGSICSFLGAGPARVAFVPYAGVTIDWDAYAARVRERFEAVGYRLESVHEADDPAAVVEAADAVAVGGGNTFHLIRHLWSSGLVEAIRTRVRGGLPYMGWSAGSNVACPTICTTNDMPIVEPPTFEALDLVPFQINPHYSDAHPPGHAGETRADRIAEFVAVRRDVPVVGLREGTMLRVEGPSVSLVGDRPARLFRFGEPARDLTPDDDLDFLLDR